MQRAINLLESVCANISDGAYIVDQKRMIRYWNSSAEKITGFSARDVVGTCCSDNILRHCDNAGHELCHDGCPLAQTLIDGQPQAAQVFLRHKQGHRIPTKVKTISITDPAEGIVGAIEVFSNEAESVSLLDQISHLQQMATIDPLTRLANRRCLEQSLQTLMEEARMYHDAFGLLMFDVDDFRQVNSAHGHAYGDRVLCMVANTLRCNMRSIDVVARWSTDTFAVALRNVDAEGLSGSAEHLRKLVERSSLTTPMGNLQVTVSGGATMPQISDSPAVAMARLTTLTIRSKTEGKNRITSDVDPHAFSPMR